MPPHHIYTRPFEALSLLKERRDRGLHLEIERNLSLPADTLNEESQPIGFCYRDVTPNLEQHRFLSVCDLLETNPIVFENPHDKYTCVNRAKYFMGKLVFFLGLSKKGAMKTKNVRLADFSTAEGKIMREVRTTTGLGLVDLHRRMFTRRYPHMAGKIFDVSGLAATSSPGEIYEYLFSLAVASGIFIENFSLSGREADFTNEVVAPAFEAVWKKYGEKPLVVPLEPTELEGDDFWYFYPQDLEPIVVSLIESDNQ